MTLQPDKKHCRCLETKGEQHAITNGYPVGHGERVRLSSGENLAGAQSGTSERRDGSRDPVRRALKRRPYCAARGRPNPHALIMRRCEWVGLTCVDLTPTSASTHSRPRLLRFLRQPNNWPPKKTNKCVDNSWLVCYHGVRTSVRGQRDRRSIPHQPGVPGVCRTATQSSRPGVSRLEGANRTIKGSTMEQHRINNGTVPFKCPPADTRPIVEHKRAYTMVTLSRIHGIRKEPSELRRERQARKSIVKRNRSDGVMHNKSIAPSAKVQNNNNRIDFTNGVASKVSGK
jgi:hypothetical protein